MLLRQWEHWEKGFDFVQGGHDKKKLGGARVRPAEVEWWTKRKRLPTPEIKDVTAFGRKWWDWWIHVNTDWRTRSDNRRLVQEGEGSWDCLTISGVNGLLSALMCLRWWFLADVKTGSDDSWTEAVAEMTWVLEAMLASQYVLYCCQLLSKSLTVGL
ncbi:hypothetical protein C8J56DRAFT_801068 [Mycena floridula]|nr:hypothetical protein C8J56DRAFT_801068 [Mycena floridula]